MSDAVVQASSDSSVANHEQLEVQMEDDDKLEKADNEFHGLTLVKCA